MSTLLAELARLSAERRAIAARIEAWLRKHYPVGAPIAWRTDGTLHEGVFESASGTVLWVRDATGQERRIRSYNVVVPPEGPPA